MVMRMPLFRKAFSRRRSDNLSKLNYGFGEDFRVGLESNLGAAFARLSGLFKFCDRNTTHVFLLIGLALSPNFKTKRFGKKVDAGNADAVQTAGDFVSVGIELAASVKFGHHDLGSALLFLLMIINGNAAPVINHCDRIVQMNRDLDGIAVPGEGFVYGIIYNFVNK